MRPCVLGIDVGTTCTKALLVDEAGAVIGQGSFGYGLISSGSCIEQRAEDWEQAVLTAARQAVEAAGDAEAAAVSFSTQGGSTVAVDRDGKFLGNSWTWMDTRSAPEADEVEAAAGDAYIYHTTGWRINPTLDAAKLRRMKKLPEYADAAGYLTTLEVVNRLLTGNPLIDPSNAAMRQLYSVEGGDWDETMLRASGVSRSELPEIAPTGAPVGKLLPEAAAAMGLRAGIPVYNGAHDQYCAAIGAGAVHDGDMLLSAGTTWVLMGITRKPLFTDSYVAPGKHPVEGLYGAIASLVSSGASLQWFKNNFLPEEFDEMNRVVDTRREKARDLFFYPYMAGANFPLHCPNARGAFTGINLEHDRFDFARAIMEGVAFGVCRAAEDFRRNGSDIRTITMMGGAAKSPVWMQMIASAAGIPILRLNQADVCALGAAYIAACGAGWFGSYADAARAMVHPEKLYEPIPEESAWYKEKFRRCARMWDHMQAYYEGLEE
ncbi:MAG: hypothetical protein HFF17_10175 [Oscillospiraceae bacterium]|nr:hypothetical protein [Oscillospiraceae bacterium]